MSDSSNIIAFQGTLGAYSHMACQAVKPEMEVLPCASFEDMILAVQEGRAALAMVPVENSIAGRVADIHHLLPGSGLFINGEHFQRVNHHLLAPKGATIDGLVEVHSHAQGLAQCRERLRSLGLTPIMHPDTAGAARDIAERGDLSVGAIASELAGQIYGLELLLASAEDAEHNTTRFLVMSRTDVMPPLNGETMMTTMVFRCRSVPAALYKALGGFATNGINLTKLESYIRPGSTEQAQFYVDVEGHVEAPEMRLAMEELRFYCEDGAVTILGTYPASAVRGSN